MSETLSRKLSDVSENEADFDYEEYKGTGAGTGSGYYDYDDESEDGDYDAEPAGIFGTPARVITLVGSVLTLMLVVGVVAWLLGQGSADSGRNVYPATSVGAIPGAELETAVRVGALAPDFELNDIYTGKPVKISSFRGKPVWVNFWASWCPPCKVEMPEMKERYARYKDKGLVILGVDDAEDAPTVKQFTELNGYNWTFVIDDGTIHGRYFVSGLPTHVFVDKAGVIRAMQVGGISGEMMDDGLAKIMGQ